MSDELYSELQNTYRIAAVALALNVCTIVFMLFCWCGFLDYRDEVRERLQTMPHLKGDPGLRGLQGIQGPRGERGPRGTIDRTADRGWIMDLIREQTYIDIRAEVQEQLEIRERYRPGNVLSFGEPSAPPAYPGKE